MKSKVLEIHFKRLLFVVFLLITFLFNLGKSQEQDNQFEVLLKKGYELIQTNSKEAITYFERALELNSEHVLARRQLGYLYFAEGRLDDALDQFYAAERISSSDVIKLQIAYILIAQSKPDEARTILSELVYSSNSDIREKASNSLAGLSTERPEGREEIRVKPLEKGREWWSQFYGSPYYDTRWKSIFALFQVRRGFYLTEDKCFSLMGVLQISGDSRSEGGRAPKIFSDNALVASLGVRFEPFWGFTFDIQEGVAFEFIERPNQSRTKLDFRSIITYNDGWYAGWMSDNTLRFPFEPFADVYSSVGYYSRYKNTIGYAQVKVGVRVLTISNLLLDVYGRVNLAGDTDKEFYNNLIEGGPGTRLIIYPESGLSLAGEYHRGRYIVIKGGTRSPEKYYSSFRLFLLFEKTIR